MPRSQHRALQSLLRLFLYARAESLLIGQGSLEETEATEFKESHPMSSENPQMADWNGGIGSKQMRYRSLFSPLTELPLLPEEIQSFARRGMKP